MAGNEHKDPLSKLINRFKGPSGGGDRRPDQRKVHFSIWYFVMAVLVIFWFQSILSEQQTNRITYSQFKELIRSGKVASVVVRSGPGYRDFEKDRRQTTG